MKKKYTLLSIRFLLKTFEKIIRSCFLCEFIRRFFPLFFFSPLFFFFFFSAKLKFIQCTLSSCDSLAIIRSIEFSTL